MTRGARLAMLAFVALTLVQDVVDAAPLCEALRYRLVVIRQALDDPETDTGRLNRELRAVLRELEESGCIALRPDFRLLPTVARWWPTIMSAAGTHGVDPLLVAAVVHIESRGDRRARSTKGAMGLMQLMPATAKELGVTDPYDAEQNVDGGTRYLAALLGDFGEVRKALAAYNAGPTLVRNGSRWPNATRRYVKAVMARWQETR